ncbi:phage protein Gp13 family protein [Mesorhizobium sp. M7A.F.Ca.CA.004.02.1.1]|uniref:phage protein Gp13 family protein n=1 Tax=Mesorhizobium sp. M7A.F.Ca.CA.004.02.1.1 TaxID=2496690 RepID=UPI0013DEEB39|nr:phage protein Gp13 family protein [Mesorhizobium sp. M7A.F.Ca.CA.004.02.1.1]
MSPEAVLPLLVQQGNYVWAGIDENGECFGLFGVDPVKGPGGHLGIVWMVTTDDIFKHRRDLLKLAPKWLDRLHKVRPLLGNHIDARNTTHIRWLRRMGFSFLRTHAEFGVEKRPFHEFARLR